MDVELPASKPLGDRLDRAEIDHVERTEGKDIGNPRLEDRIEPRRPARQDAADDLDRPPRWS